MTNAVWILFNNSDWKFLTIKWQKTISEKEFKIIL